MARPKGVVVDGRVIGHRLADVQLTDSFGSRRCVCECGYVTGWWSTPQLAADEWRVHAGVDGE